MITEQPDNRREQRIYTALPVHMKSAEGITRDVSASGVFFWTSESICAAGELISFSVELFPRLKRPEVKMRLRCQGDVVRTEPHDGTVGVAVKITESAMEFA
jgi:PilZ domain-containing protein